jgi:hypothetical protein
VIVAPVVVISAFTGPGNILGGGTAVDAKHILCIANMDGVRDDVALIHSIIYISVLAHGFASFIAKNYTAPCLLT